MNCVKCGNELKTDDKFCENCGEQVSNKNNNIKGNNNKIVIILIVIIAIILLCIVGMLVFANNKKDSSKYIGYWKCKGYSWDNNSVATNYIISLKLNNDGSFVMENLESNKGYIKGDFKASSVDKKETYRIDLKAKSSNISGYENISNKTTSYEMNFQSDNNVILTNYASYNVYYCDKM